MVSTELTTEIRPRESSFTPYRRAEWVFYNTSSVNSMIYKSDCSANKKHGRNLKSKHQSETEGKTESKTEGKIHLASEHKKIVEKHKAKGHEL